MQAIKLKQVQDALTAKGAEMGIEVVEVVFKRSKDSSLSVFIDRPEGIDLDTCEAFHKAIDIVLDELDPTEGMPYTLNVSSLGLDRVFKTPRDFDRNINKEVELKLYAPIKGKKTFEGVLTAHDQNTITVQADGQDMKFEKSRIAKITKLIRV